MYMNYINIKLPMNNYATAEKFDFVFFWRIYCVSDLLSTFYLKPVFSRGGYPPPAFLVFSVDFLNEHLLYLKFIVNFYVLGLSMSMSYSNRVPPPPWGPPRCKSDRFASQWLDASKFSRESNFILLDFRADAYLQLFGYIFEIFSSRSFEEYQCWNSFILISKLVENVFKNIVYINIPSVAY